MVSMVAFAENTEHYVKTSPRARGQDRSYTLSTLRCSKLNPQAALREPAPQKDAQLGSCSRDPIGYEGSEWNLFEYCSAGPSNRLDPSGKDSYWIGGANPIDHSLICVDDSAGAFYCCTIGPDDRGKSSGSTSCAAGGGCSSSGGGSGFWHGCSFVAAACGLWVHPISVTCGSYTTLPSGKQKVTTYPQSPDKDAEMVNQLKRDAGKTWWWNGVFSNCHVYVGTR